MIILVALTSTCVALQDQHAAFHPRDAAVFVQVPDTRALAEVYPRTGLWRMVADEEVHAALGPTVGAESLDLQAELDALVRQGLEQAGLPSLAETGVLDMTALSFSLALPIAELSAGASNFQTLLMEKSNATLVLEFVDADAGAAFGQALEKMGVSQDAAQHLCLWRDDRYVVLLAGKSARADFEARLVGEVPSFAERQETDGASKHLTPAGGVTVVEGYSALGEVTAGDVPFLSEAGPLMGLLKGTCSGNLGVLFSGGHFRMQLRNGRFVTESFRAEAPPTNGGAAETSAAPATDALALLDPEALVGGVAHVDPAALLAAILPVSDTLLQMTGAGAMAGLEESYGFHVGRDLLDPLGRSVAFSLGPITGPTAPDFRVVAALKDRERFLVGMQGLGRLIADLAGEKVEIKESEYRKTPLFTFSWRSEDSPDTGLPFDIAGLFKPTVAVLEDRVLLTLNSRYAKDEVRRLDAPSTPSTNGQPPAAAGIQLAREHVPAGAFEAGFSDWIGMVARLYTTMKNLAPMAAGMGVELPFDPEELPEADVFTRFFQPGYHWQKRVPGGVLSYAESSLGPEAPLLFFGGLAAAVAAAQSGLAPWMGGGEVDVQPVVPIQPAQPDDAPPPAKPGTDPDGATREALAQLAVGIAVYRIDQGALPEELVHLERATSSFPDGFLGGATVPQDGWGRAFRYERAGESYRLWSVGADGNDQSGSADDVLAR